MFQWIPAVSGPAARNVELMVDFDGWKAEPMQPGANGSFRIARMVRMPVVTLSVGEPAS